MDRLKDGKMEKQLVAWMVPDMAVAMD